MTKVGKYRLHKPCQKGGTIHCKHYDGPDWEIGKLLLMQLEPQKGLLFSRVYLKRGEPTPDSTRMRNRIGAALLNAEFQDGVFKRKYDRYRNPPPELPRLYKTIEEQLGIHVPWSAGHPDWRKFASKVELRDLLDTVTLLKTYGGKAWIDQARTIFMEENVPYSLDEQGGVHLAVDQEFHAQRLATISVLSSARYKNVTQQFEAAYGFLDQVPNDGKSAMRANFNAVEGIYRLMFPAAPRLAADAVATYLKPHLQAHHNGDQTAQRAAQKAVQSFQGWIDTMHFYRHEPGTEEPAQPPLSLAILTISQGANWLRWLAELDGHLTSRPDALPP